MMALTILDTTLSDTRAKILRVLLHRSSLASLNLMEARITFVHSCPILMYRMLDAHFLPRIP